MAQLTHDERQQQQGSQFGYNQEWLGGGSSFGNAMGGWQDQAILNQDDNTAMQDFFNNPDGASMGDSTWPFNWELDQKYNAEQFAGQIGSIDHGEGIVQNPAVTLASPSLNAHATHSGHHQSLQSLHQAQTMDYLGPHPSQNSAEFKGANNLLLISQNQGQMQSRGPTFGDMAGGSWGNIGANHPMMQMQESVRSPLNSSGQQTPISYQGHQQHYQHMQSQPHMMDYYQQGGQSLQRHPSLQVDTSGFNFFPNQAHVRLPQSAHIESQTASRPAPPVRFGSDSNFGNHGYKPPLGYGSQEYEKGANLNNVPLAAQAAANARFATQAFTPTSHQRTYQVFNSHSANSSPALGGLPVTNTMSGFHGHPATHMLQHAAEHDEYDGADEFEDSQPRKRRKSQVERDEEAEYTPVSHVNASAAKRGPRMPKAPGGDGSDDEYDPGATPSFSRPSSNKRRKSTVRGSSDSSAMASPTAMASPAGDVSTMVKRKSGSQSRQNLTDDQKRKNHIASEKTRRDLIKKQYEELDNMVPALKGGKSGLSRSDILNEIVSYVESVVAGNERVESLLG